MLKKLCILLSLVFLCAGFVSASGGQEEATATKEIVIWEELWANVAQAVTTLADTPLYKTVQEKTGVKVTWIHPAEGQQREQFNLLIASNELPDMIYQGRWDNNYPGGPVKAIEDGVVLTLNDLIDSSAPNLKKRLADNPAWDKAVKTDSGDYWCFPFIRGDESLMVFNGPVLRADILDELGLAVPETMDEWYDVLTALKAKSDYPLTFTKYGGGRDPKIGSAFASAYGIQLEFYHTDNKVMYGQYEAGYKDFLATMAKWYADGLLDPEFVSNDRQTFEAKVLNGNSVAFVGYGGSNVGRFLDAMEGKDTGFDLVGARYPVVNKGDKAFTGQIDIPFISNGMVITTQAKDPKLCAEWADYAYGDEGHLLFNFGIEGESYDWVDGFPLYSDMINKNPNGLGFSAALGLYSRAVYSGPIIQDERYIIQYYRREQQLDAWEKWQHTDAGKHRLPALTFTPAESEEFANIMSEINTYSEEMYAKFITGTEPIENFDQYIANLKKMGIEDAVAIQQAALDRYNKR